MVKFRVCILSQPTKLVSVSVYTPELSYTVPFQIKLSHAVAVVVDVLLLLMVKFSVAILSQPTEFVSVSVYTPELVYVVPFQL